jgi:ABC-type cobalamin transport system permease subunit
VKADQTDRFSDRTPQIILAGVVSAVISTALMALFWKEQPFFAFAAVALYFMGGVRGFPWKTPIGKAISIGAFVGIVASSAIFYSGLL